MAKKFENVNLFITGSSGGGPVNAFFTYDVKDGKAKKTNCVHTVENPDFSKKANKFWDDELNLMKSSESIS